MEKKKCPNCGEELYDRAKFCMNCGMKIQENELEKEEKFLDDGADEKESMDNIDGTVVTEERENEFLESEEEQLTTEEVMDTEEVKESEEEQNNKQEIILQSNGIEPGDRKKRRFTKKQWMIGGIVGVLLVWMLIVMSSPEIIKISVAYYGDDTEGIVLDEKNEGIIVTGYDEEGKEYDLTNWKIEKPVTLEMDDISQVIIKYKDIEETLYVECSTSEMLGIIAEYDGDAPEGTVLDFNNTAIKVKAKFLNGSTETLTDGWTVKESKKLVADEKEVIEIKYENFSTELEVQCTTRTVVKLSASYDGEKEAGTKINEDNEGIHVTAEYKDGEKVELSQYEWTLENPGELKTDKTSKFKISYGGKTCTLKIECSTMSEGKYKKSCKSISYDKLARDPDTYMAERVKFKGRIVQVMEDDDMVTLRVNVTNDGYGYYDDTVYVYYSYDEGESKLLEDDIITFYGISMGLYTYESVMGASITIPCVISSYIDLH